jgi:hypothetical protein
MSGSGILETVEVLKQQCEAAVTLARKGIMERYHFIATNGIGWPPAAMRDDEKVRRNVAEHLHGVQPWTIWAEEVRFARGGPDGEEMVR